MKTIKDRTISRSTALEMMRAAEHHAAAANETARHALHLAGALRSILEDASSGWRVLPRPLHRWAIRWPVVRSSILQHWRNAAAPPKPTVTVTTPRATKPMPATQENVEQTAPTEHSH